MISIESSESQLYLFEFLSAFKDHKNIRKRLKTSFFKTLNAIYLITITNERKGREFHYPSKEWIADFAKIDRSMVTEFITSEEVEIFCEVKRSAFCSNHYFLKDWVYQWFRLFYRSGMMKGLHENYQRWLEDFHKRIKKWLIPLVQAGKKIKEIYESVVNKLSTRKSLKTADDNSLKTAGTKSYEVLTKPMGSEDIEIPPPFSLSSILEMTNFSFEMVNRFFLKEADVNSITKYFNLMEIKSGIILRRQWERNGIKSISPVKTMIGAIKKSCYANKFRRTCA